MQSIVRAAAILLWLSGTWCAYAMDGLNKHIEEIFTPRGLPCLDMVDDQVCVPSAKKEQRRSARKRKNSPTAQGVAFANQGVRLAVALSASSSHSDGIQIKDMQTGQDTSFFNHPAVNALAFDATGQLLLSGAYDGTVKVWDIAHGQQVRSLQVYRPHNDKTTCIWNTPHEKDRREYRGMGVWHVAWSGDGTKFGAGTVSEQLNELPIIDFRKSQIVQRLAAGSVSRVVFNPADSDQVATIGRIKKCDSYVSLWSINKGECTGKLAYLEGTTSLRSLAFSPDGSAFAFGGKRMHGKRIYTSFLFDCASKNMEVLQDAGRCSSIAFDRAGKYCMVTNCTKNEVLMINTADRKLMSRYHYDYGALYQAALSVQGEMLALLGSTGIQIVNAQSGKNMCSYYCTRANDTPHEKDKKQTIKK